MAQQYIIPFQYRQRRFHWNGADLYRLFLFIGMLFVLVFNAPDMVWYYLTSSELFLFLGMIGLWRYSWWFIHFIRAQIYQRTVYPRRRLQAEQLWNSGWRPQRLYFMMTTYKEERSTTEKVMQSIIHECRTVGVPATLFLGSGDIYDERIIQDYLRHFAHDMPLEVIAIRQPKERPGKRFAIAFALRAMSRYGVGRDDPIVFMDGDSILVPGCLQRCLPMFHMFDNMHALTTDEKAIVFGPKWMQKWLDMRFAQRHLAMQSHALSNKVLTLTGRMSVFRARHVIQHDFIRLLEADHLEHWLWGQFRFLSGDDKSSWYALLCKGADMTYVPDALVYTIEYIEGNGIERMKQNLLRWSGNMLRNGTRAIHLGPRRIGWFIWWCIVDQRLAMWTMLISPIFAIVATLAKGWMFLYAYLIWITVSRLMLSMFLFYYAGRIELAFTWMLYVNQVSNAIVKVYVMFRLPMQRWANRGNQKASNKGDFMWLKRAMATYLTGFYVTLLVFLVVLYVGLVPAPSWLTLQLFLNI
jgi:glycosyltransferase Alg8